MSSLSKTMLIGNLGRDPEVRYTRAGKAVTTISLATTKNWKDKVTGKPESHTEWHRLVLFNRLAEIAGEYLRQGSQIYVEGENRTRKWQHSDGSDRYTTEVVCSVMNMLGKNPNAQVSGAVPSIDDGSWPSDADIPFEADNTNAQQ